MPRAGAEIVWRSTVSSVLSVACHMGKLSADVADEIFGNVLHTTQDSACVEQPHPEFEAS